MSIALQTARQQNNFPAHQKGAGLGTGNRCGHNPQKPRVSDVVPVPHHKRLPPVLHETIDKWKAYYVDPSLLPSLRNLPAAKECRLAHKENRGLKQKKITRTSGGRLVQQNRAEVREAQVQVACALLQHTDLASLRIGNPLPDNGFWSLTLDELHKACGNSLSRSRFDDVIRLFREGSLLSLTEIKKIDEEGNWRSHPAVKCWSENMFLALGISLKRMRAARQYAYDKQKEYRQKWEEKNAKKILKKQTIAHANFLLTTGGLQSPRPKNKTYKKNRKDSDKAMAVKRQLAIIALKLRGQYPAWTPEQINYEAERMLMQKNREGKSASTTH